MKKNRIIVLKDIPKAGLSKSCFSIAETPLMEPSHNQVLIKVKLLSIDAAIRAWMQGPTYRPAVKAGDIMPAYGLGEVISSKSDSLNKGDLVSGELNWSDYTIKTASYLTKISPTPDLSELLTFKGIAGLTAYHGLFNVSKIKMSDTILVSSAAGSVGTFVCQIAKVIGCRVIALTGSQKKCAWVEKNLGVEKCFNYRDQDISQKLKQNYPEGFNVFFDNVGGSLLEKMLYQMALKGRVVCCGAISQYNTDEPFYPRNIPGILITKRLRLEGFIVMDFQHKNSEALDKLSKWFISGALKVFSEEYDGLENAPEALINLLEGKNLGKTIVKV